MGQTAKDNIVIVLGKETMLGSGLYSQFLANRKTQRFFLSSQEVMDAYCSDSFQEKFDGLHRVLKL